MTRRYADRFDESCSRPDALQTDLPFAIEQEGSELRTQMHWRNCLQDLKGKLFPFFSLQCEKKCPSDCSM